MPSDPELRSHQEWLGMVQPTGLVASARALAAAGAFVDRNDVSTALAEQVLEALNLLLRGFQAAHEASGSELLREVLRAEPSHVYGGLLSVLLRLVFILYAEERGLLPADGVFESNYSLTGLFEELREDAARYPTRWISASARGRAC
jgi:hypothetical protein